MSAKEQVSGNAEEIFRNFVATRPRRPRSGRVIAGVAAGIGRRYAIDPVIIRVALVVTTIYGGAGVLAYLVGWLLLAAEEDQVSPFEALLGRGHSSTSKGLTVLLCIALIPAGAFTLGGHFPLVAGVVVLVGGLFLLHRYRGDIGQVDSPPPAPVNADPEAGGMTDATTPLGPQDAVPPEYGNKPPAWDPLGAAPFAWDLPEPTPVPPQQPPAPVRRRRARTGLATMGVVLVAAAVMAVVAPTFGWLTPPHIIGVLGAIAGVGLVVGAFTHSGRGLIPVAVLLSAAGFLLTSAHFTSWHGAGSNTYQPTTIAEVLPVYQQTVGNLRVDLSQLPSSGDVHTSVSLGVGDVTVVVPDNATVHATCRVAVGDMECLGVGQSGPGNRSIDVTQQGTGANITVNVLDGPGRVTVVDASAANHAVTPVGRGGR